MATGRVKAKKIKQVNYRFSNLAQYSPYGYYLYIPNVKSKLGIPADVTILSATTSGWSGLGTIAIAGMAGADDLLVFFSSGWSVTSASYITVWFTYIED